MTSAADEAAERCMLAADEYMLSVPYLRYKEREILRLTVELEFLVARIDEMRQCHAILKHEERRAANEIMQQGIEAAESERDAILASRLEGEATIESDGLQEPNEGDEARLDAKFGAPQYQDTTKLMTNATDEAVERCMEAALSPCDCVDDVQTCVRCEKLRLTVALAIAEAKVAAFGMIWDDEGWGKTLGDGRTFKDLVREAKAERDAILARLTEGEVQPA